MFARPDSGSALGLQSVEGTVYQTVFSSDGIVTAGAGTVFLHDGSGYDAISIFVAGGVQTVHWDGSTWK